MLTRGSISRAAMCHELAVRDIYYKENYYEHLCLMRCNLQEVNLPLVLTSKLARAMHFSTNIDSIKHINNAKF